MEQGDRQRSRQQFIECSGWGDATVTPLAADASFRRYFRLHKDQGYCLLMDAPPPREDITPFIQVARHLQTLGLKSPEIYQQDIEQGFALLEDFGDDTFTRLLAQGADETALYQMAVNLLVELHENHNACDIDLPAYDDDTLLREAMLLPEWFYPALMGEPCPAVAIDEYKRAWLTCFQPLHLASPALVLRDFHVDNLMQLVSLNGNASCGLLDFQDALIGSAAYDLMSLLEDARRDVSNELQQQLLSSYLNARPELDHNHFMSCYRILAAQRHAKVAGIFVRLSERDGKSSYLAHIPRVVTLLEKNLQAVELAPIRNWFEHWMPDLGEPLKVTVDDH